MKISTISIQNFKSIRELKLDFKDINIFVGANGAGKSNLISFFKLLNQIVNQNLQMYVAQKGGADNILYFGSKISKQIRLEIVFNQDIDNQNNYNLTLYPSEPDSLFIMFENAGYKANSYFNFYTEHIKHSGMESGILEDKSSVGKYVKQAFQSFKIYHFHDTSDFSPIKKVCDINDNQFLREDASNLASFLYLLQEKYESHFKQIQQSVRLIAPFFDRFDLKPSALNEEKIRLEWKEVGTDKYFNASHLSDGSLRMICLLTLLLQPKPPQTIIIDEPELGLHPSAIQLLASLIKSVSHQSQVIISTQSVTFINQFEPENIVIVERKDNQSVFKRLENEALADWLNDYALGEIWEKNVIGGRP